MSVTSHAIKAELAKLTKHPVDALSDQLALKSLVSESFVLIEIVIELQEIFDVRLQQQDMLKVATVGDLVALIVAKSDAH